MNVRMEYFGFEVHFWWHDWILWTEADFDKKDIILIWGIFGSLYKSFP